ncbi:hypothetical protein NQ318_003146 [Aromia moschata]|uniref:Exonuclease domain-containing protein n=1 Tax=Aromia moschata TaxID=1265417 RepID=A0AAV8YVB4_9CUCU|nr:hypothetical protein NQ318_003146 [Aromia moschata]
MIRLNSQILMILLKFLRSLSTSNSVIKMGSEIRTFIFLDIETTGLPFDENNTTKITELCLVAVQATHIRLGVFPRVQNKLNFCFNPWKLISAEAEKITGLSNSLLEHQSKFSADTVESINSFLNLNRKPICLVAHNADNFDYPILRAVINKTGKSLIDGILCVDSIKGFRELYFQECNTEESEVDSSVPLEFTATYDALLCDLSEETESGLSQKAPSVSSWATFILDLPKTTNQFTSSRRRCSYVDYLCRHIG